MDTPLSTNLHAYQAAKMARKQELDRIAARQTILTRNLVYLSERVQKLQQVRPNFIVHVLRPLGQQLCERMGGVSFDVMGPFGLFSERMITVRNERQEPVARFSFEGIPDPGEPLRLRDYSRTTDRFEPHSLGAFNGGNATLVPVQLDGDPIAFLIQQWHDQQERIRQATESFAAGS